MSQAEKLRMENDHLRAEIQSQNTQIAWLRSLVATILPQTGLVPALQATRAPSNRKGWIPGKPRKKQGETKAAFEARLAEFEKNQPKA